jgi:solute carrier family 25 thiamine pyrophosphate transporter 19
VYERLRGQSVFSPVAQTGTAAESFLKGATAAAGATTLTYPFDLLRTRMVLLSSSHLSLLSVLRNIIAKEGPLGLFKGYSLTVSQVLPYMGAIFAVHDTALQSIKARALFRGKEELVAGGTAGLLCKTCFMPIDVLRRRFQILRATGTASASVYQNHTYLLSKSKTALIRHMWQHEGIRGFFRGWSMAVVKTTPTTAITFFIYNYLMRSL